MGKVQVDEEFRLLIFLMLPRTYEKSGAGISPGECGRSERWLEKAGAEDTRHSTKAGGGFCRGGTGGAVMGGGRGGRWSGFSARREITTSVCLGIRVFLGPGPSVLPGTVLGQLGRLVPLTKQVGQGTGDSTTQPSGDGISPQQLSVASWKGTGRPYVARSCGIYFFFQEKLEICLNKQTKQNAPVSNVGS